MKNKTSTLQILTCSPKYRESEESHVPAGPKKEQINGTPVNFKKWVGRDSHAVRARAIKSRAFLHTITFTRQNRGNWPWRRRSTYAYFPEVSVQGLVQNMLINRREGYSWRDLTWFWLLGVNCCFQGMFSASETTTRQKCMKTRFLDGFVRLCSLLESEVIYLCWKLG